MSYIHHMYNELMNMNYISLFFPTYFSFIILLLVPTVIWIIDYLSLFVY